MSHSRRAFLSAGAAVTVAAQIDTIERSEWSRRLEILAKPVLESLSQRKLRALMPVESPHNNQADRAKYSHLEAFGRLLSGMAPWLELNASDHLRELVRTSITAAVDPNSPDYMNFENGAQPVVDAAFLALGLLRSPNQIWAKLDTQTRDMVLKALRLTRKIKPGFNNWLLFSATIEAFFCSVGEEWDAMRVDYAIRQHDEWYKGDGLYGDGPVFHWDYYNSFVIHPMLQAVMDAVKPKTDAWDVMRGSVLSRAKRYAAIQERLIAPDGSFPAIGRSLVYRFGAFHHLADMSLRRELPETLKPAQARCALAAVMKRCLDAPGTFDANGWLSIGLCGHQPAIAEPYISTGSAYLCATGFLPLGLPATDEFWSRPPTDWTSKRVWSGQDVAADHALPAG